MKKLAIAAVLSTLATAAFAQEAPYRVIDGQVTYPGVAWSMSSDGSMIYGQASLTTAETVVFPGNNINWSQNYSGL